MALRQLFTQRVGYAVHALCYMAKRAGKDRLTTVPELSEWMCEIWPGTSPTYLATVIQRLVRGGILISQRGVSGGYGLARDPQEISLHDVVAVLEGSSYAWCALTPTGKCAVQSQCENYSKLCRLEQQYTNLLAELSLADLARDMAAPLPECMVNERPAGVKSIDIVETVPV